MEKTKVKTKYLTKPIQKDAYPQPILRLVLTEAFCYTVNHFTEEGKISYCLVCGKWFLTSRPQTRACSKRCRNYLTHIVYRLHCRKLNQISRRFRQTPLYLFLYLAVKEGILSPRLLGEEKPEDLPPPILSPTDFVELFGMSTSQIGKELSEGVRKLLREKNPKEEGKREVTEKR